MRSLLTIPVVLLVLVACDNTPQFELAPQLSCHESMLFDADLTTHLTEGPGDGSFDYDPEGKFQTRIDGSYDLGTGDFQYEAEYDPDAWMTKTEVEGFGFAKEDGDLDVRYTSTRTDINGDALVIEVRVERVACHQTIRFVNADIGVETVEEGDFSSNGYVYTRTTPIDGEDDQVQEGVQASDLTFTETLDWSSTDYDYSFERSGDADGYTRTDWTQITNDYDFNGTTEVFLDGSEKTSYTGEGQGVTFEQEYEYDYNGNGEGTYTQDGTTCDLFFDNFECTYDCGRGGTGTC